MSYLNEEVKKSFREQQEALERHRKEKIDMSSISILRDALIEFEKDLKIKETGKYLEVKKIFDQEIERLESLNNLLKLQLEILEHNIDLLDSNYQSLINGAPIESLLKLPESLKPTIEFPEFKIIPADEGQDLSHNEINLKDIL